MKLCFGSKTFKLNISMETVFFLGIFYNLRDCFVGPTSFWVFVLTFEFRGKVLATLLWDDCSIWWERLLFSGSMTFRQTARFLSLTLLKVTFSFALKSRFWEGYCKILAFPAPNPKSLCGQSFFLLDLITELSFYCLKTKVQVLKHYKHLSPSYYRCRV